MVFLGQYYVGNLQWLVMFVQDFDGEFWSKFWSWSLVKTLRLKFDRNFEAEFWSTYDLTEKQLWRALNPWVHCALGNVCHYFGIVKSPHYSLFPRWSPRWPVATRKSGQRWKRAAHKEKRRRRAANRRITRIGMHNSLYRHFHHHVRDVPLRDYAVSFNNVQNKLSSSSSWSSKLAASLNTKYSWEKCARVEKKYIWNSFETATMLITIDVFECK